MTRGSSATRVLWSAVIALAAAGAACAQTYDLNARYPTGAVLEVRETQEVRVKVLSGMLKPPDGDIRRLDRATVRYRVLKDEAGFPTSQEAIIVSSRSTVEEPGSEPVRERSPVEGVRILVQAMPNGERRYRRVDGAELDGGDADCCDHLPVSLTAGLDLGAVEVGAEWTVPPEVARQALGLGEGGSAQVKLKFAGVVTEGGNPAARIAFSVSSERAADPGGIPQVRSRYSGEYLLDLHTHLPRFVTATGDAHLALPGGGEDGLDLVLAGPMKMTIFYEPLPQMAPAQ